MVFAFDRAGIGESEFSGLISSGGFTSFWRLDGKSRAAIEFAAPAALPTTGPAATKGCIELEVLVTSGSHGVGIGVGETEVFAARSIGSRLFASSDHDIDR
jgi:hypothetical protein